MNKKFFQRSTEQLTKKSTTKITPLKSQNTGRRLVDNNPDLANIPDRRTKDSERRNLDMVSHSSPVRRYTIDRRTNTKDRRTSS